MTASRSRRPSGLNRRCSVSSDGVPTRTANIAGLCGFYVWLSIEDPPHGRDDRDHDQEHEDARGAAERSAASAATRETDHCENFIAFGRRGGPVLAFCAGTGGPELWAIEWMK